MQFWKCLNRRHEDQHLLAQIMLSVFTSQLQLECLQDPKQQIIIWNNSILNCICIAGPRKHTNTLLEIPLQKYTITLLEIPLLCPLLQEGTQAHGRHENSSLVKLTANGCDQNQFKEVAKFWKHDPSMKQAIMQRGWIAHHLHNFFHCFFIITKKENGSTTV